MGNRIPFSFINEPDLCPNCYYKGLRFIDPYNNKVIMNDETLEKNQKYFLFCPKCKSTFHIYWENNKFCAIPKEEYFSDFINKWENNKNK